MISRLDAAQPQPPQPEQDQEDQKIDQEAEERSSPSGQVVYHAILKEGDSELERKSMALFWSGLAAGLSMSFSLITEGLLRSYLPEARWAHLISKLGYSIGFLIVVLGRQQLFTENTLTPILPLMLRKEAKLLWNVLRLWGVVLIANLIGAFAMGWVLVKTSAFEPDVRQAFLHIGHTGMVDGFGLHVLKGIFAGWLIALMVWLLPFAETARVWVIILITYVITLGSFPHVIAGAVDVFALAAAGEKTWAQVLGGFIIPTLIGNILGGVSLVAALNHAQVIAGEGGKDT